MNKLITAAAVIIMAACTLHAELITGSVDIPLGSTNAIAEVTLNRSASWQTYKIDSVIINGPTDASTTATISLAAADLGVIRQVIQPFTLAANASTAVYPVRTNTVQYQARTFRVSITQNTTNANVYTFGVITTR